MESGDGAPRIITDHTMGVHLACRVARYGCTAAIASPLRFPAHREGLVGNRRRNDRSRFDGNGCGIADTKMSRKRGFTLHWAGLRVTAERDTRLLEGVGVRLHRQSVHL